MSQPFAFDGGDGRDGLADAAVPEQREAHDADILMHESIEGN